VIQVTAQIRVNHFRETRTEQFLDLPYGVLGAPFGTIRVLLGLQICLEDWPQDQNYSHLHDAIANTRDAHSALPLHPDRFPDLLPSPTRIIRSAASVSKSSEFAEGTIRTSLSWPLTGVTRPSP
jgi:hypothetical protein